MEWQDFLCYTKWFYGLRNTSSQFMAIYLRQAHREAVGYKAKIAELQKLSVYFTSQNTLTTH